MERVADGPASTQNKSDRPNAEWRGRTEPHRGQRGEHCPRHECSSCQRNDGPPWPCPRASDPHDESGADERRDRHPQHALVLIRAERPDVGEQRRQNGEANRQEVQSSLTSRSDHRRRPSSVGRLHAQPRARCGLRAMIAEKQTIPINVLDHETPDTIITSVR